GQRKVLVGDAAGGVSLELHPELAPGDRQVGVVVGGLAEVADGVGEHQRCGPAVGVVLAAEPAVFHVPAVEAVLLELGEDFGFRVDLFLFFFFAHGSSPSCSAASGGDGISFTGWPGVQYYYLTSPIPPKGLP